MTIKNNSGIQTTISNYYINNKDFNSNLFFTSTSSELYYILIRTDNNDGKNKVVLNGKFIGRSNGLNYDYRFNYDKFIKIDNQLNNLEFTKIDDLGSQKFSGFNSSKLFMCLATSDLLQTNITNGKLSVKTNGEIWIANGQTPSTLVKDYIVTTTFWDKEDDKNWSIGTKTLLQNRTFVPITVYNGATITYYLLDSNRDLMWSSTSTPLVCESGKDYTVYLIYLNDNIKYLHIYNYNNSIAQIENSPYTKVNLLKNSGNYTLTHNSGTDVSEIKLEGNIILKKGTYTFIVQARISDSGTYSRVSIWKNNDNDYLAGVEITKRAYSDIYYHTFTILNDEICSVYPYIRNKAGTPNSGKQLIIENLSLVRGNVVPKYYSQNPYNLGKTGVETFEYSVNDTCYKPYYFFNTNGMYDVIYCTANKNIINNVEKEYININDKQFVYKINTTEQIRQNSGFDLTESQVYSLIKTPYVREIVQSEYYLSNPNFAITTSSNPNYFYIYTNSGTGGDITKKEDKGGEYWNYKSPSGSSLLLVRHNHVRLPNIINLTCITSLKIRNNNNFNINVNFFVENLVDTFGTQVSYIIPANSDWVIIKTNPINLYSTVPLADIYRLILDVTNLGVDVDIKDVKIEIGNKPTDFSKEIRLYTTEDLKPKSDEYIVENNSFDGWTGKNLSEKNLELIFTNPVKKSRKTNIKKDFYL